MISCDVEVMTMGGTLIGGWSTLKKKLFDASVRARWELLRRSGPFVAVEDRGMRFVFDRDDYTIGCASLALGLFDFNEMERALSLCREVAGVDVRGRGFVDVGANVGTSTVPALCWFGANDALAFEPSTSNARILGMNLVANDIADRVTVVRAAVSDTPGTASLELATDGNHGDHRVRDGESRIGELGEELRPTEQVPTVRLAEYHDRLADPALLWVDTQGHEAKVLAGAGRFAEVPAVVEFWPYALNRSDGVSKFAQVVSDRYNQVIDVRASLAQGSTRTVGATQEAIEELALAYQGPLSQTDLLLMP